MLSLEYERWLLALCMWREASGEGNDGMLAVGCVVRNRVRERWFSGSWELNITGKNQFTSISVLGNPQTTNWPHPNDPAFVKAAELALALLKDEVEDITNGALYYENPRYATSKWFKEHISNRCPVVATIGRHVFYGRPTCSTSVANATPSSSQPAPSA